MVKKATQEQMKAEYDRIYALPIEEVITLCVDYRAALDPRNTKEYYIELGKARLETLKHDPTELEECKINSIIEHINFKFKTTPKNQFKI